VITFLAHRISPVVLVLLVGLSARAQMPADTTSRRDPTAPMWTSLGATVIPTVLGAALETNGANGGALIFGGLWLGPSVGYWTHGVAAKSTPGLLIRAGGFLLAGIGEVAGAVDGLQFDSPTPKKSWVPDAMVGVGFALVVGSAVYDIVTVDRKVREHRVAAWSIEVAPLLAADRRAAGVEVFVRF
jgi:hypothetical protein